MDDDLSRKISLLPKPSDNEHEIEEYENCVMELKNQKVNNNNLFIIKIFLIYNLVACVVFFNAGKYICLS